MKEQEITLFLTEEHASELRDLLGRINDQYEKEEPYASITSKFIVADEPLFIYHSEATALNKLLVQLDAKL